MLRRCAPGLSGRKTMNLRPRTLDEYIGQTEAVAPLRTAIAAALKRGEALDHVLLGGPPGLGKTSLAAVIAHEMGTDLISTSAPALKGVGDIISLFDECGDGDVLLVDELHRLDMALGEALYTAMDDYVLDTTAGGRAVRYELPAFTLVGATTRTGLVAAPLRDRFGLTLRLVPYPPEDLVRIANAAGSRLGVEVAPEAAGCLASRSRGTPRLTLRLLRRARDMADVQDEPVITKSLVERAMDELGIDAHGLDAMDHAILRTVVENYAGGPVGIAAIAASMNEDPSTVEDVYEPYLLQQGLLQRTPRGRVATDRAVRLVAPSSRRNIIRLGRVSDA